MPKRVRAAGQVTVELLLALGIFFLIMSAVMELGNIYFQAIVANHAAYEVARVGAMTAGPPLGDIGLAQGRMSAAVSQMFPKKTVTLSVTREPTLSDPQVSETGGMHMNEDLVVTLDYPITLVFPFTSYFLARPVGSGRFHKKITVRMPLEKPLPQ